MGSEETAAKDKKRGRRNKGRTKEMDRRRGQEDRGEQRK